MRCKKRCTRTKSSPKVFEQYIQPGLRQAGERLRVDIVADVDAMDRIIRAADFTDAATAAGGAFGGVGEAVVARVGGREQPTEEAAEANAPLVLRLAGRHRWLSSLSPPRMRMAMRESV